MRGPRRSGADHRHRSDGRVRVPLPAAGRAPRRARRSWSPPNRASTRAPTCRSRSRSAARSRQSWSTSWPNCPASPRRSATSASPPPSSTPTAGSYRPRTRGRPGTAGRSTKLFVDAKVDGSAPAGTGEVALDSATAAAAGVRVGDKVEVVAAGRAAAAYRVTALVDAPDAGILFADPTAVRLSGRAGGERAGTVDLVALRTEPGTEASVAAAAREKIKDTARRRPPAGTPRRRPPDRLHRLRARRHRLPRRGRRPLPADPAGQFAGRDHHADHRVRDGRRAGRVDRRPAPRTGPDAGRRRDPASRSAGLRPDRPPSSRPWRSCPESASAICWPGSSGGCSSTAECSRRPCR